jgi:hypothetical protein
MTDELWTTERRLWLEGAEAFAAVLDPGCLMVFPDPVGVLAGRAILDSLEGAPRWAEVTMDARRLARPGADTVVLVYYATGHRDGAEPYRAWCSSTYVRGRLVQHQQTPR